jgi:hypothetical protein
MRTGYRLALGVAGITLLAAIALLVAELLGSTRDANAYGEVSVPGRESVSLPAGEVIVFYGARGTGDPSSLAVPGNLTLRVRTTRGQLLGSTPYAVESFSDGDYLRRSIAKIEVPEAGAYEAVSSSRLPGVSDPVLAGGGLLTAILGGGTALVASREGGA